MSDDDLIRRGDAFAVVKGLSLLEGDILALPAAVPAVRVDTLRAAFDAGSENGWDHARSDALYGPEVVGHEEAFAAFLAALDLIEGGDKS